MLGAKIVVSLSRKLFYSLFVSLCLLDDLIESGKVYLMLYSAFLQVISENRLGIYGVVGENSVFLSVVAVNVSLARTETLDLTGLLTADDDLCIAKYLACNGADDRTGCYLALNALCKAELFVVFVTAYGIKVISLGVEEKVVYEYLSALNKRRLAGTQLFVDLLQRLLMKIAVCLKCRLLCVILFECSVDKSIVAEHIDKLLVRSYTHSTQKYRDRYLSRFIYLNIENIVLVCLIFEPCSSVGDDRCGVKVLSCFVDRRTVVNSGRTNELRYDNSLRTVDNERTRVGHEREITHVYL